MFSKLIDPEQMVVDAPGLLGSLKGKPLCLAGIELAGSAEAMPMSLWSHVIGSEAFAEKHKLGFELTTQESRFFALAGLVGRPNASGESVFQLVTETHNLKAFESKAMQLAVAFKVVCVYQLCDLLRLRGIVHRYDARHLARVKWLVSSILCGLLLLFDLRFLGSELAQMKHMCWNYI